MNTHGPEPLLLVGLTGYKESGKDIVAAILQLRHGCRVYEFAENIRELLRQVDPLLSGQQSLSGLLDDSDWSGAKRHRIHGPEVHRLMQVTGSSVTNIFGQNAWIDALARDINEAGPLGPGEKVVISDVHQPHEAEWIRRNGGVVWHVDNPAAGPVNNHHTEHPLPSELIDLTIHAGQGDQALREQVLAAVEAISAAGDSTTHVAQRDQM